MNALDRFGPLVTVPWLAAAQGAPDLRVIDLRWYLSGRRGADEFARGHIPGAVFVDLDLELTAPSGPGRHPIPSAALLNAAMQRAGIQPDSRVVVYDDAGGSVAARLWWLLRYYRHDRVAVLDGGLQAWTAAGYALTADTTALTPGAWRAADPRREWVVDKAQVVAALAGPRPPLLLDARARERYRGDVEPIDARPGHIPSAVSAPFSDNLTDGRFKSAEELRRIYEALGAKTDEREVIAYCGSGVTACHDLLAIELASLPSPRLYEGSWSDWARDPSLPAATGNEP